MALWKSPHAAMVFNVRPALDTYNARGEVIATRPPIRAEFGIFGPEQPVHNPLTGSTEMFAEVVGHFFDSDLWYEQRLGDQINDAAEVERCQEEKEYLELVLTRKCREVPQFITEVRRVAVAAPRPWASYNTMEPAEIVDAAQLLALVPEAVAYERENAQRPDVLGPLEEKLADLPASEAGRAKPAEEFPEGSFDVERTDGVAIGKPQGRTDYGMVTERAPGNITLG